MSGRIRSVKPEWLEDEVLALASSDARVLSIALLLVADDHGRGRANKLMLAGQVFPGKPLETLAKALEELRRARYVQLYEVEGQSYFAIRNWAKHQRVDKPSAPRVPGPPKETSVEIEIRVDLANVPGGLASSIEILAPDPDLDPDPDLRSGPRPTPPLPPGVAPLGADLGSGIFAAAKGTPSRRKPKTHFPEALAPLARQREKALAARVDCDAQFAAFRTWHLSKGSVFADWSLAFDTWLARAPEYSRGNQQRSQPQPKQPNGGVWQPRVAAGDEF
jgi:hypothetical protein